MHCRGHGVGDGMADNCKGFCHHLTPNISKAFLVSSSVSCPGAVFSPAAAYVMAEPKKGAAMRDILPGSPMETAITPFLEVSLTTSRSLSVSRSELALKAIFG